MNFNWRGTLRDLIHQSIPAPPTSPPLGYCGALARLVSPGGGAFANFELPGGRPFANPKVLTRRRLYWKNKTIGSFVKDGKKLKRIVKACSRFYAYISSLLIKPELHMSETRELSTWINVSSVIESSFPWYYLKNILSYWNHKLVSSRRQLTAWSLN